MSGFGWALHGLGLPLTTCQALRPSTTRHSLEAELGRALDLALPPVPSVPRSATSIVAVIGPQDHVLVMAQAVADEIGAAGDEMAIATQRKVWRRQDRIIATPEAAAEERRAWRWRDGPSVVVVEQPVRAGGSPWAAQVLRALRPTLCWGVTEASHKPEDVAAWSRSLGGLDVLAVVDLAGTTTPASMSGRASRIFCASMPCRRPISPRRTDSNSSV